MVPGLTGFFQEKIARIPQFDTDFISKKHFLHPETQNKQLIFLLVHLMKIFGFQNILIDFVSIT